MGKIIISLLVFAAVLIPSTGTADEIKLAENAPDRYIVLKGDTLWGISAKFLKDPWRWPDVWGLNKDEIKNPHWIYPGDVVILDFSGGTPRLRKDGAGGYSESGDWQLITTKLSPTMRTSDLAATAISSIPLSSIGPFLSKPLIVDDKELKGSPQLIAGPESRVVLTAGDVAFARNLPADGSGHWSVYRPGRSLVDPDTKEMLGREAIYLGDARVDTLGPVSTLSITEVKQEISPGDRLFRVTETETLAFVPHSPSNKIQGKVIAAADGALEIGPQTVVVLNRGGREGVEVGNVFELYRDRPQVHAPGETDRKAKKYPLPPEKYGVVFVFRVFNKLSYALVMNTTQAVNLLDVVRTP
ncbi:MAG: LysM peptidoglycan-binding domain-containing protein [Burkholderiales bacterium]